VRGWDLFEESWQLLSARHFMFASYQPHSIRDPPFARPHKNAIGGYNG
jgi:hypothetical protein